MCEVQQRNLLGYTQYIWMLVTDEHAANLEAILFMRLAHITALTSHTMNTALQYVTSGPWSADCELLVALSLAMRAWYCLLNMCDELIN